MKRFANYISEKAIPNSSYEVQWMSSAWEHILGGQGTGRRSVPFTSALINKIWKTPITATVFHITDVEGATHVLQNQGKKGVALSVLSIAPQLGSSLAENGVWRAGVVLKLKANILMAGMSDIMSVPDESGRRWLGIPEVARTLPTEYKIGFTKELEAKQKTIYQDFADELREYAPKVSSNKKFVESNWSYDQKDLVFRIINFRDTLMNAEKAGMNKIIGKFVKTHIDATNQILEKYLIHSKERVQQIADGRGGGLDGTKVQRAGDNYSELVANQYKVIGIAWMPYMAEWGAGEDKMRAAAGDVPILIAARKTTEDSAHFSSLMHVKDMFFPVDGKTPEEMQIRAAYRVFARKSEIPWWTSAGKQLAKLQKKA